MKPHNPGEDEETPALRFRAIFISDIHLGTPGCQAEHLLDFLRHTESDELYLVGDIIDGWQLKRRWYWHQSHNDVIQKVLRKARKGTRVTYVAGNHDEALRQFLGLAFGGIEIATRPCTTARRPAAAGDPRRPLRRGGAGREVARAPGRRALHLHAEAEPAGSTTCARKLGLPLLVARRNSSSTA